MGSGGMKCIPNSMTIGWGVNVTLWSLPQQFQGCNVGLLIEGIYEAAEMPSYGMV
jgi:hypothetical protein